MSYNQIVQMKVPPSKVYEALMTEAGIHGFWTGAATLVPEIGGKLECRFGKSQVTLKLVEAVPETRVVWKCTAQHFDGFDPADEWVGTRLVWEMRPKDPEACELEFTHQGLTDDLKCWESCSTGWDQVIRESLKGYLETGTGVPYEKWKAANES